MSRPQTVAGTGTRALALAGIVLVSLNLRAAATSVPPILGIIGRSFPIGDAAQSVIGTLPLVSFAFFGIVTPRIVRAVGIERLLVAAMALVAAGELSRAVLSQSATQFIAMSILCLGGMGIANVLVPPAIARYFPDRLPLVSGLFQTLIAVSASLPSLFAVSASDAFGWRAFVGAWSVLAVAAALPWLFAKPPAATASTVAASPRVSMLRSPSAWAVMLVFAMGPMLLYSMIAWLPTLVTDTRGVDAGTAAAMLSVFNAVGLVHGFVVPNVMPRLRRPYPVIVFGAACMGAGPLGLAFASGSAWLWVIVSGLGAMLLNAGLILVAMHGGNEQEATALSSFVQSGGYLVAAFGPLAVGALHSLSGGWAAPAIFLASMSLVALGAGIPATRRVDRTSDVVGRTLSQTPGGRP